MKKKTAKRKMNEENDVQNQAELAKQAKITEEAATKTALRESTWNSESS